jgi:hypothetical protein
VLGLRVREVAPAMPAWTAMRRQDIDASVPLTLFDLDEADRSTEPRPADECGTPDLFTEE